MLVLVLTACGQVHVDPPINIDESYYFEPISGDPSVLLGFYKEQLYTELKEGDPCPIIKGTQGGTWTMPVLRTTGIGHRPLIECEIVMSDDGELVGESKGTHLFYENEDGYLEAAGFGIEIQHFDASEDDAAIDDVYGRPAEMTCNIEDSEGRGNSQTVGVVLVEG